jgi:hypothetical protein
VIRQSPIPKAVQHCIRSANVGSKLDPDTEMVADWLTVKNVGRHERGTSAYLDRRNKHRAIGRCHRLRADQAGATGPDIPDLDRHGQAPATMLHREATGANRGRGSVAAFSARPAPAGTNRLPRRSFARAQPSPGDGQPPWLSCNRRTWLISTECRRGDLVRPRRFGQHRGRHRGHHLRRKLLAALSLQLTNRGRV